MSRNSWGVTPRCFVAFGLLLFAPCVGILAQDTGVKSPEEIAVIRARAEAGDAEAQCMLGTMYTLGNGVPLDKKEAAKWYRMAADQGHAGAQFSLGLMYTYGKGVPEDSKGAA